MNKTMTKEEYVASIRELEEIITKYREQEKRLKEQYINVSSMKIIKRESTDYQRLVQN